MKLLVGQSPDGQFNRVAARHVESIYQGETAQHRLAIAGDISVKVLELNPWPREQAGETVTVGFDAEDLIVLTS